MADKDFLDEVVAERTAQNPNFPNLVDAAVRRRELLNALAAKRREDERSQTAVATT
jgi:hypothetical protein